MVTTNEGRLPLNEAAKLIGVSRWTMNRWITHGVRGVKLKGFHLGGRIFVAKSDIDEFSNALNGGDASGAPVNEAPNGQAVSAN